MHGRDILPDREWNALPSRFYQLWRAIEEFSRECDTGSVLSAIGRLKVILVRTQAVSRIEVDVRQGVSRMESDLYQKA